MTHIPGRPIAFDPPGEWKLSVTSCRRCNKPNVVRRTHQSSCGSWEDDEYKCNDCEYVWWVDGIDS